MLNILARALIVVVVLTGSARGEDMPVLVGTVTRIVDGDTIEVEISSGPIKVRLHGIDTPERRQPWGIEASAALSRLVLKRQIELAVVEQRDRYDRMIARVLLNGRDIDGEMIQQGHAWAFRRDMTKADTRYCAFEESARAHKAGLWGLQRSEQVPPWEYRKRKKSAPPWHSTPLSEKLCVAQIGNTTRKIGFVPVQEPPAQPLLPILPVYRDSDQPKDSSPQAKLLHFNGKDQVPGRLMVQFMGAPQIDALKAHGLNVGELPTDGESARRVATEIANRVGAKFVSLLASRRKGKGFIAIFEMTDEQARDVADDPRVYLIEPDFAAWPAAVYAKRNSAAA